MNINYKQLKQICLAPIQSFTPLGDVTETRDGIYIYKQNPKAKILGVAHLDTVLSLNHFHKIDIKGQDLIFNAQLDDRLGVYVLTSLLPSLGVNFDLLLTEGEESGQSTAAWFDTSKNYNWMFSFDRRGEDVVMYQYDTDSLRKNLKKSKFTPALGSFSDIAFLDHLGISGINVGTGYEGEHSDLCFANMSVLKRQIARFMDFYRRNQNTKLTYTKTSTRTRGVYIPTRYNWEDWGEYDDLYCYLCNKHIGKHQIINDIFLCDACFGEAAQCTECQDIVYADELQDGICINCQEA